MRQHLEFADGPRNAFSETVSGGVGIIMFPYGSQPYSWVVPASSGVLRCPAGCGEHIVTRSSAGVTLSR